MTKETILLIKRVGYHFYFALAMLGEGAGVWALVRMVWFPRETGRKRLSLPFRAALVFVIMAVGGMLIFQAAILGLLQPY